MFESVSQKVTYLKELPLAPLKLDEDLKRENI